ncbi:MAG: hypothetical protein LLG14_16825 [Nocardiaceae bacterium]|nr:hypothetical protein [Nocardiaceae bacterium]
MSSAAIDVNDAITLHLKQYPGTNDPEFNAHFGVDAEKARQVVRTILDEAMRLQPDWDAMSLNDAGDFVEAEMYRLHPELSPAALKCLGNYHTYLMR